MPNEFKVFFSWQADLPSKQTRRFIEESIDAANEMLPKSIILIRDDATRNKLGSPDIMNSIFDKIDDCDLFIADVSIVGSYIQLKSEDNEKTDPKFFPNPNVLLELGYASGRVTWERCICLANTTFGDINKLPFDLNHRRITAFSYSGNDSGNGRKGEINRIAEIIASTVAAYVEKPLQKKDFSHHAVGGFNLETGTIESHIIPYNEHTFGLYIKRNKMILDEIADLIKKIYAIHLPPKKELKVDFDAIADNMTLGDIMKDSELYKAYLIWSNELQEVKANKQYIDKNIKKYLGIELCDDFYDMGGLLKHSIVFPHSSPSLEGTDLEKEKYGYIQKLESKLLKLNLREMFIRVFDNIVIVPLAISNISTKNDERISVSIKVTQGVPIQPTSDFFDPEYVGCEGAVYDEHLIQELLQLPENSTIKFDSSLMDAQKELYSSQVHMPHIDAFGYATTASDAEDYEQELQDYVQEICEGSSNEYCFTIGALRPNETLWLDKVLLIKPVDGKIHIDYSIKSNNSTGNLTGTLSL